jgi:hypothetical protein
MIAQAIGETDVEQTLGLLSVADQDAVKGIYHERPESLVALLQSECSASAQYAVLLGWCETRRRGSD